MNKRLISVSVILFLTLTGCKSGQEAMLIEEPETRIYKTFEDKTEDLFVGDCQNIDVNCLKDFYLEHLGYVISEENLRRSIQIQSNEEVIISFDPVVDSVSLNNSYIMIIRDQYIIAVSSNPTKFVIPESFNLEQIITLEEQQKLNNKIIQQMSKKGKARIKFTDLYFETQRIGKLIYTIKVDVETVDYSFGEVFVYDGFTGDLID